MRRDNYTCRFCDYKLHKDYYHRTGLAVHHIVPVHKTSALFFDEDNLITCCHSCHIKLHCADKHHYKGAKK